MKSKASKGTINTYVERHIVRPKAFPELDEDLAMKAYYKSFEKARQRKIPLRQLQRANHILAIKDRECWGKPGSGSKDAGIMIWTAVIDPAEWTTYRRARRARTKKVARI